MQRPINRLTTGAKVKLIEAGLYRPARLLIDHLVDRHRLGYHLRRRNFYRQMISPGDLCFDVGANIGDYTDALVSLGARVIAVDPQPSSIKELQARFAHNDRVIVVPVALGANEGSAEFFLREQTWLSGFIEEMEDRANVGSIRVPIKTLDQLITTYGKPKYIKIDVEGYELPVIMGLHSKVELISVEYCLKEDDYATKLRIIEYLKRFGELRLALLRDRAATWTVPWAQLDDFLTVFPSRIPKEAGVGDIFVQII
jgi:FkbM family methyltransferase